MGLISSQLQQHDKAIASFTSALELDPFLVSAEFGLARSYQRSGKTDAAKTHMDRFTRLTQEKIASAMSLSYGDQGPLSLAQAVLPQAGAAPAAIAVKFVAPVNCAAHTAPTPGRAGRHCFIDADGDGAIDYVQPGRCGRHLDAQRRQGRIQRRHGAATDGAATCATVTTTTTRSPTWRLRCPRRSALQEHGRRRV